MGSIAWDIIMSFLWIALSLSSLLPTPSLSSISPLLRHIDNNNQDGPHFRSFLFPSSLRSVNTHQIQTSPTTIEAQRTSLSPKNVLPSDLSSSSVPVIYNPGMSGPEISQPSFSVPEISHPRLSVHEVSQSSLSVPEISQPSLSVPKISHPSLSVQEISHSQSMENMKISESSQLSRNSLQPFTVELHPEEELVRSG